jgi:hypothetical protein
VLGGYLVWRVRATGSSSGSGSELELGLIFGTSSRTETKLGRIGPGTRFPVYSGGPPNTHVFPTVACFL